jgi:pyruvate dehydrogenase E2 component (dihydrolipoamide acetyltransferase)
MAFEFKLPDVGEGVTEGEIVAWHVAVGDPIEEDQTMVEVMTDKATVAIPSPVTGTVVELMGEEGDIIAVHSVLLVIDTDGTASAEPPADPAPDAEAPPRKDKPVEISHPESPEARRLTPVSEQTQVPQTGPVLAAPATRRIARELGIDLASITGTGKDGRVTRDDVLRLADGVSPGAPVAVPTRPVTEVMPGLPPAAPAPAASSPSASTSAPVRAATPAPTAPAVRAPIAPVGDVVTPIRGLRRRIAEKMKEAWTSAVHFTFAEEADVTRLVELRKRIKPSLQAEGIHLTYLPFIVKATTAALRKHPQINATINEERQEITEHGTVHMGIATATDRGLMVPVIKDSQALSLKGLAVEIGRLGAAAKGFTAKSDELSGSTFTITSLGVQGGLFATPIINHPEVAIMGIHRIRKEPRVVDGEIVARDVMCLTGSFDHRIIDGHIGAAFIYDVIRYLEDPDLLLLEMV